MTASPANILRPPHRPGPKERIAPTIARGRQRDVSHETRDVPPIEAIRVARIDCHYRGGTGGPPIVTISLPRVKFLERPEK